MTPRNLRHGLVAGACTLALLGGACSSDDGGTSDAAAAQDQPATTASGRTDDTAVHDHGGMVEAGPGNSAATPGADLRATLTSLLDEHTYLAAMAVFSAVNAPAAFDPAVAALDENSVALSEAVGSVYGEEAGSAFLEMWRTHIGFFVDYANARVARDGAAQDAARLQLETYFLDLADFLAEANPEWDADALAEGLQPHADTLLGVIDAVVDGSPDAFAQLRDAGGHMAVIAEVLAVGIVAQDPAAFAG